MQKTSGTGGGLNFAATAGVMYPSPLKAAKIPLGIELGIDEFHFNDFSLDNDAMITASLRMFLDLGAVQKFKIDYEVRREQCVAQNKMCVPCTT